MKKEKSQMKMPLVSFSPKDLYGLRTVIMVEVNPQSNDYKQLILNKEQFVEITAVLKKHFTKGNSAVLPVTRDNVNLPDSYRDYYQSNKN